MDCTEAVHVAQQVARGLQAAHESGVVHRDLKPDNVFILQTEEDPLFVKIMDFGIAKLGSMEGVMHRTQTGQTIGTPYYMSPEQWGGNKSIDQRSDVYSLGVVFFELITGRLPFGAEGFGEIVVQHMLAPPPAPSSLAPDIPPHIESATLRALKKDPDDRFQTMAEFADALDTPPVADAHSGSLPLMSSGTDSMELPLPDDPSFETEETVPAKPGAVYRPAGRRPRSVPVRRRGAHIKLLAAFGSVAVLAVLAVVVGLEPWDRAVGSARSETPIAWDAAAVVGFMEAGLAGATGSSRSDGGLTVLNGGSGEDGGGATDAAVGAEQRESVNLGVAVVRLVFETRPAGTEIRDSQGLLVGRTPHAITVPRGFEPLTFSLSAKGYRTQKQEIVPDEDQVFAEALAPLRPSRTGRRAPKKRRQKRKRKAPIGDGLKL